MKKKKRERASENDNRYLAFSCCVPPNLSYSTKVPKTVPGYHLKLFQGTVFPLSNCPTEAAS